MATPAISNTSQLTTQQWFTEKATTYGKVGVVGVGILGAAAAVYMAPVTVVLSTLAVCLLSAAAVRYALSGQFSDSETVKKMLVVALAITGIALGGVALGLTPLVGQLFIGALQATSLGSAIVQLSFGSFLLTSVWGYAGGLARSALENAFSLSAEKIGNYLKALQDGTIEQTGVVIDPLCMFAYLAFKQDLKPLLSKMPDSVGNLRSYLATDEELKENVQKFVQIIGQMIVLHAHVADDPNQSLQIEAMIYALLTGTKKLIDNCSTEAKKQSIEILLDKFPSISEISSCQPAVQIFLHQSADILNQLKNDFFAEFNTTLTQASRDLKEIAISSKARGADMKALAKRIFDLQGILRELKQKHTRLGIAFPEDEALKNKGEEIKTVFAQVDEQAKILSNKESSDEIDMEDSVWNCLITQAQYQEKIEALLTELKNLLGVTSNDAIDAKMSELGLDTVKSLFDKGIVSREEFLKDYTTVQKKVFEYIKKAQQTDFRSKLYEVLSAATSEKPDLGTIQTIASKALYRLAMAFSLLAPVIIAPVAGLVGGVAGLVAFGAYSLFYGRISTLQDMREFLKIDLSQVRRAEVWVLSIVISSTTRRTLLGFDDDSQRDLRTFINADFFGKMRLLSWEFGFSTLMAFVALLSKWPVREAIRDNALLGWLFLQLGPSLQGAMFAREFVDGAAQVIRRT